MEIEEIQKRVLEFEKKWESVKNIKFDEQSTLIHLTEELGELAQQVFYRKAKPEEFNEENVKEEICDVILTSLCMADRLKMNISEEINKKLEKLKNRDLYKNQSQ
jgi:NTP pyrophosphatase (non-canonical NTP hydrolase)